MSFGGIAFNSEKNYLLDFLNPENRKTSKAGINNIKVSAPLFDSLLLKPTLVDPSFIYLSDL